jgi:hypothetical protein
MCSVQDVKVESDKLSSRLDAQAQWNRARRAAFWARLQAQWAGKEAALLNFNEVSRRLKLHNTIYRGAQSIPLDRIVGSMGRYNDFTRTFLPVQGSLGERWRGVAEASLDPHRSGLPPIEAYQVGTWYFVKDGNHRCSVARQLGMNTVEAYVWEYTDALPSTCCSEDDIETLLLVAERQEFFEQTRLNDLRPGHAIQVSEPGGYTDMLDQIVKYQGVLGQIDEVEMAYAEAVTAWYDMLYEPSVQLIGEAGILESFPNRTAADLFIWMMQNRAGLQARYGGFIMGRRAAVHEFERQHSRSLLARLWRLIPQLLGRR